MAADGKTASVNYKMQGDPNDLRNQDIVRQVRSSVVPRPSRARPALVPW